MYRYAAIILCILSVGSDCVESERFGIRKYRFLSTELYIYIYEFIFVDYNVIIIIIIVIIVFLN